MRAFKTCDVVTFWTGQQVLALRTFFTLRFAKLVLSWRAKDTVIPTRIFPYIVFARNLISFRVANVRVKFGTLVVNAVEPVLQSGARPHVCAAYLPQRVRRRIICLTGTISMTLDFFELLDAGFPHSFSVAVHAGDLQMLGRYLVTNKYN